MFAHAELMDALVLIAGMGLMGLWWSLKTTSSKSVEDSLKRPSSMESVSTTCSNFSAARPQRRERPVYSYDIKPSVVEVKPVVLAENETRTTVLIKNLPNKITKEFVEAKVADFTSNFNKVTLVMDRTTGFCKGFGFIQFTAPQDAIAFMRAFDGMTFIGETVNGLRITSTKAMKVGFADIQ